MRVLTKDVPPYLALTEERLRLNDYPLWEERLNINLLETIKKHLTNNDNLLVKAINLAGIVNKKHLCDLTQKEKGIIQEHQNSDAFVEQRSDKASRHTSLMRVKTAVQELSFIIKEYLPYKARSIKKASAVKDFFAWLKKIALILNSQEQSAEESFEPDSWERLFEISIILFCNELYAECLQMEEFVSNQNRFAKSLSSIFEQIRIVMFSIELKKNDCFEYEYNCFEFINNALFHYSELCKACS